MENYNVHWDLGTINEVIDDLKYKFEQVDKENKRLKEENDKLKNGLWKEEQMAYMKKEYDRMSRDYYRGFPITEEEDEKIQAFIKEHSRKPGPVPMKIDGIPIPHDYIFTPTAIGMTAKVVTSKGDEFVFRDVDSW